MRIEIVGGDGSRCQKAEQVITTTLKKFEKTAEVSQITDAVEIARRGINHTPAIVIDGIIRFQGRLPSIEELSKELV